MNDIYINLIIIAIIIILFLAYVLIAYFYNNYKEYKVNVDDTFYDTKSYINKTNKTLSSNITNTVNKIDNVNNNLTNIITSNYSNANYSIIQANNDINVLNSNVNNDSNNLNTYDSHIKNYLQFRDNSITGDTINTALFNHRFNGNTNDLSLNMLTKITAISGMTIKTEPNTDKSMRICDNNINTSNCIDMNVDLNGNFNIYPSALSGNNVNNISIFNKNKAKTLATFDMTSNKIYLGGDNENAGMLINESNVYLKNVNFLKKGTNYSDLPQIYDKTNNDITQTYNKYLYDTDDIIKVNKLLITINGIYTIIKSTDATTPNSLIINFKSSIAIPINKTLVILIDELNNTTNGSIANIEVNPVSYTLTAVLNPKKIILSTGSVAIPADTNVRVKLTDTKITTAYTEPYIVNTFTTTIT